MRVTQNSNDMSVNRLSDPEHFQVLDILCLQSQICLLCRSKGMSSELRQPDEVETVHAQLSLM